MRILLGDEIAGHEDMFRCKSCGSRTMVIIHDHLCCERCESYPEEQFNELIWIFFNSTTTVH